MNSLGIISDNVTSDFFPLDLQYFQDRLKDQSINSTHEARDEYHFNNWMTLLSQLPLLLFTLLNSFLYQRSDSGF